MTSRTHLLSAETGSLSPKSSADSYLSILQLWGKARFLFNVLFNSCVLMKRGKEKKLVRMVFNRLMEASPGFARPSASYQWLTVGLMRRLSQRAWHTPTQDSRPLPPNPWVMLDWLLSLIFFESGELNDLFSLPGGGDRT